MANDTKEIVPQSSDGFLRVSAESPAEVNAADRAALIRKGNELFNAGKIDVAKKIFLTVRYSDGLLRVGEKTLEAGDALEALRLFWLAGDRNVVESMTERMAGIVRQWLKEDA